MSKATIDPHKLGEALAGHLALYHNEVLEELEAAGEEAVKKLVKLTKQTAPKLTGDFKKSITYVVEESPVTGDKVFVWGAKAPHHRIVHLLVNGHQKKNGGRVDGNPFLAKALEAVLPEYERKAEEALKID